MLTLRLAIGTAVACAMVVLTSTVGARFLRRAGSEPEPRAVRRFGVWWVALGIDGLLNALTWLAGGLGIARPAVVAPLVYLALTSIAVMLWGLVSHLVFLITGRADSLRAVTVFYAVQLGLGVTLIAWLGPEGVELAGYGGTVTYERTPPAWAGLAVAVFFLLPPLAAAVAYGVLARRAPAGLMRRRMRVLAAGIVTWFLASILVTATDVSGDIAAAAGFALALGCMSSILWAYRAKAGPLPPVEESLQAALGRLRREEDRRKREALAARLRSML